jgi:tetratricopeptide (TPR) repeat protein
MRNPLCPRSSSRDTGRQPLSIKRIEMKPTTRKIKCPISKTSGSPWYSRTAWVLFLILYTGLFTSCAELIPTLPPFRSVSVQPEKEAPHKQKDDIYEAYTYFTFASIAISQGHYEEAQKYLSIAIEKDPESSYLNRKMALLMKEQKKYQESLDYAQRAIALDPKNIGNLILLGDIHALMDNEDLAIAQYDKILALDPENQRVRLLLTTILIRKQQFQKALTHLQILTEQRPELIIAHYYRGRINLEIGRYRDAEEAFLKALKLNESLEPALFDLGTLYQMTDRVTDAVDIYERLVKFYPDNIPVRERLVNLYFKLNLKEKAAQQIEEIKNHTKPGEPARQRLGLIYLQHGKIDESIEELNLIISAWPQDDKSRYYLATAYEEKGDSEKALEHFRDINPKSRYFVNAQLQIAYILNTQEKYDEAIDVLEKAIILDNEKAELFLMLATVHETKKDYLKALEIVREGLRREPQNVNLIFRLGVILDKSGDKDSCIEQMKKILEINPDHAEALNYIGYTYAEQGIKLDEAMAFIKKAASLKPESGYILDSLGWVYFQKGLYDEAIQYLDKAAKLTSDDPTINEHLGDAYSKKNKYNKALHYYKKAMSLEHPDKEKLKKKITEVERLLKQEN